MKYIISVLLVFGFCCCRAQVNLNAGLVAYYPFSGNTNDASGNGNNATNFGATLTTDQGGNANSAYYFDGGDYMRIINNASLNLLPQISLSAKVKVQSFYNGNCYGNCIIDKGLNDFTPGGFTLRFSPGNYTLSCNIYDTIHQNYYNIYNGVNNPTAPTTNPPYIQKDQWDCLVYTFDGATNRLWVNGTLRYQYAGASATVVNTDDVFLGRKNDTQFPYWFKGVMDEVRIYNRALNIQEIDSLCGFNPPVTDTIINKYGAVLDRLPCSNTLVIDTAMDFNVGDTILMIQMKGAEIDSSNTAAFGTVMDYKGAGNYEYNVIKAKSGNVLTLKHPIVRSYNIPEGKVQIVRVPSFQGYTVNQPHTCMPWDGNKGGVLAMHVTDTLKLNANINVQGRGFLGGQPLLSTQYSCNRTDYYYPATNNYGGQKGEGIAMVAAAKRYGRGALGNGGGGGNDHNSGGGGGSNAAQGGLGGNQFNLGAPCGAPIIPVIGGIGGTPLAYSVVQNKVFMGGGGGSGHGNNLSDKAGGKGGGIILIDAGTISRISGTIIADGGNAIECNSATPGCQDDGGSGGGGGGGILLKASSWNGNITVSAKGGKGADVWVSGSTSQVAPGGGGSGGAVWYSQSAIPVNTVNILSGGASGILPQFGNTAWGAQPGLSGQTLTGLQLNFPVDTFSGNNLSVDFSDTAIDCFTYTFNDLTTPSGAIVSRNWDFAGGGTSVLQAPTFTFPGYGTYQVTLTVTDSSGCNGNITKEINIPYIHFAHAGNDTTVCDGGIVTLRASGGVSYSWSPAEGLSNPNGATTSATIEGTTNYIVTVKNSRGCIDRDTVMVSITTGNPVSILSDGEIISCRNSSVQLMATGASAYVWRPGIYCDDSTSASPNVKPPYTTLFTVVGTSAEGCTSQDTITVVSYNGSAQLFMPNAFSPNGDGKNDKIRPVILCGFTMEQFAIFNRWGERVFVTTSPTEGWNGFYKNKPADVGTYYYYIKGKKEDRTTQTFKGDILLMR